MARVVKQVKTCDRCGFGKEQPARHTRRFCIDSDHYEIDLCDMHTAQFDRDIGGWALLSREIDAPVTLRGTRPHTSTFITEEQKERDRAAAELRAAQDAEAYRNRPKLVPQIPELPEPELTPLQKAKAALCPPQVGEDWFITEHAKQRAEERGFSNAEMLAAAAMPERTNNSPGKYGERAKMHHRGQCAVAVDPVSKVIITVMPRDNASRTWLTNDTPMKEKIAQ